MLFKKANPYFMRKLIFKLGIQRIFCVFFSNADFLGVGSTD